jgi:hypothetical protein
MDSMHMYPFSLLSNPIIIELNEYLALPLGGIYFIKRSVDVRSEMTAMEQIRNIGSHLKFNYNSTMYERKRDNGSLFFYELKGYCKGIRHHYPDLLCNLEDCYSCQLYKKVRGKRLPFHYYNSGVKEIWWPKGYYCNDS